jgi:alpha/beta superfamily hydrolase
MKKGNAVPEQKVAFFSGKFKIEGRYSESAVKPQFPSVICHPHPAYGGTMDNNVVMAAVEALQETGHSTLRFNFRGVGRSEGRYDNGVGETEDLRAAMEFVWKKAGDAPVILVGYSFGSWIAAKVLQDDTSAAHVILIAPPTSMFDLSMLNKDEQERSRHIIVGERDQFCDRQALQEIYNKLPEPKSLRIIPHTDHFFFAHEKFLIETIKEAVADHAPK